MDFLSEMVRTRFSLQALEDLNGIVEVFFWSL
jgi:hypothetical protein